MKTKNTIIAILLLLVSFFSINAIFEPQKDIGKVETMQGVYIYSLSVPVAEYKTLGSYAVGGCWDCSPFGKLEKIVKKAKEKYPDCEAIILKDMEYNSAEIIKFK